MVFIAIKCLESRESMLVVYSLFVTGGTLLNCKHCFKEQSCTLMKSWWSRFGLHVRLFMIEFACVVVFDLWEEKSRRALYDYIESLWCRIGQKYVRTARIYVTETWRKLLEQSLELKAKSEVNHGLGVSFILPPLLSYS